MESGTLREMIHINLVLLYNNGHNIDFEEGMFQERNLSGFEKVAYALSLVISPQKAKKDIPWPLLDDKKLRNEFRLKFCKFIKTVNTKYDAKIPELSASNLQYPGGLMFLNFMYRLSTFAMELDLKRILGPEEKGELVERFDPTTKSEIEPQVCSNICQALRIAEEEKIQEHEQYQAVASSTIKELEEKNKSLEDIIKSTQAKLRSTLADLDFDEPLKNRLSDINCDEVLEEWNQRTVVKINELKQANERLCQVCELTSRFTEMILKTADDQKKSVCLDGSKLNIPPSIDMFTNLPVRSNKGDIYLRTILEAGLMSVKKLTSSSRSEPSQQAWAQQLKDEIKAQTERARKCSALLNNLETACIAEIAVIRPILYAKARASTRKRPEWFSYLRSAPLISPLMPSYSNHSTLKQGRKRRLSSILKSELQTRKKKTMNVCTSFKLKRPFLHPRMTPSHPNHRPRACSTTLRAAPEPHVASCLPRPSSPFKKSRPSLSTIYRPSCKKSLYGKLPTGKKPIEDDNSLESSFPVLPKVSEGVVDIDATSSENKPVVTLPKEIRKKRRSLDVIVKRFNQIKARQNVTQFLKSTAENLSQE